MSTNQNLNQCKRLIHRKLMDESRTENNRIAEQLIRTHNITADCQARQDIPILE